jgi:hypothetical protein
VTLHTSFWEFDAYGKDSYGEDNASKLECDLIHGILVLAAPAARVKYAGTIRT